MKAIILAAGEGTRLRPYTLDRPKCLVEIDGISLLDRQLAVLRSRGLDDILLLGGYRAEMLYGKGARVRINPQYSETNMVSTLFCAEDELVGDVIISYGDIVYSADILDRLMASPADISVVIDLGWEAYWRTRNDNPLLDAETLKLKPDGRIIEIGGKPTSYAEVEGQYIGLIKVSAKGIPLLRGTYRASRAAGTLGGREVAKAHVTDMLQALIDQGYDVHSIPINSPWIEIDTVGDLYLKITKERVSQIEYTLG